VSYWQSRLATGKTLDEFEASKLLRDFNFPINTARLAACETEASQAASELGYPVVLKTAEAGILHKTDCGGVKLGIRDTTQLIAAYTDLSTRLGPRVMVSPMLSVAGVEMVLGLVRDEQFGPLVMLGFGGINVETIRDVVCALPPFSRETALRLVNSLKLRPLLDGLRNRPAVNLAAFCLAAEQFSIMAAALGEVLDEVDVNPVIVYPDGCMAVDALVVGRAAKSAP
jgi:succinyl-CoA synthetase beta subunit